MIVVARNNGPNINNLDLYILTKGKSYKVMSCYDPFKKVLINIENLIIPKNFKFYIDVIADNGKIESFWNDYFLSSQEMLNKKLKKINE